MSSPLGLIKNTITSSFTFSWVHLKFQLQAMLLAVWIKFGKH